MNEFINNTLNVLSHDAWLGIYAALTLGLLSFALFQWLTTKGQFLAEHRPYVIVTVEPSKASPQLVDFIVRNIGRQPAKDVCISVDPPLKRAREAGRSDITKAKMLNENIAMIAPGQEMRIFYDNMIERRDRDDLPSYHKASYTYRGDYSKRVYEESCTLDVEALKGTDFISVNTIHDVGKSLKSIEKVMKEASLLRRDGVVEVDASVEPLHEKQQREDQERQESSDRINEILEEAGFHEEAASRRRSGQ